MTDKITSTSSSDTPFWERAVAYHGEPAAEVNDAIWKVAAGRSPDPIQQSAFNDGAHYVIQHLREAMAEVVRLATLQKTIGSWTDKDAFLRFDKQTTAAHRTAWAAFEAVIGSEAVDAMYGPPTVSISLTQAEADALGEALSESRGVPIGMSAEYESALRKLGINS